MINKILSIALIIVIICAGLYIIIAATGIDDTFKDIIDDTIDPVDVVYLSFKVTVYKPLVGGGDWQVNIPEIEGYLQKPGHGTKTEWFGDTTFVLDINNKVRSVKFDHGSLGGFTSTTWLYMETNIKDGEHGTYPFSVNIYIDGINYFSYTNNLEYNWGDPLQIVVVP